MRGRTIPHYGSPGPGLNASAIVSDVASQVTTSSSKPQVTTSSSKPTSHDHTNNLHTVTAIAPVHTVTALIARRREMLKA